MKWYTPPDSKGTLTRVAYASRVEGRRDWYYMRQTLYPSGDVTYFKVSGDSMTEMQKALWRPTAYRPSDTILWEECDAPTEEEGGDL